MSSIVRVRGAERKCVTVTRAQSMQLFAISSTRTLYWWIFTRHIHMHGISYILLLIYADTRFFKVNFLKKLVSYFFFQDENTDFFAHVKFVWQVLFKWIFVIHRNKYKFSVCALTATLTKNEALCVA